MPKQIHNIQQFHGGLSSNSDPRDINDTELSSATDVMVDEIGKIRMMGGIAQHYNYTNTANNPNNAAVINPGYGLFQFSHDRTGASIIDDDYSGTHTAADDGTSPDLLKDGSATFPVDALIGATVNNTTDGSSGTILDNNATTVSATLSGGSDDSWDNGDAYTITAFPETGDDYLAMADTDAAANIDIYSRVTNTWGTSKIDLGSTTGMKPTFYAVDGALRVSDGNFNNTNKWYGYIDRKYFGGDADEVHDAWKAENQLLSAPTDGYIRKHNGAAIWGTSSDKPLDSGSSTGDGFLRMSMSGSGTSTITTWMELTNWNDGELTGYWYTKYGSWDTVNYSELLDSAMEEGHTGADYFATTFTDANRDSGTDDADIVVSLSNPSAPSGYDAAVTKMMSLAKHKSETYSRFAVELDDAINLIDKSIFFNIYISKHMSAIIDYITVYAGTSIGDWDTTTSSNEWIRWKIGGTELTNTVSDWQEVEIFTGDTPYETRGNAYLGSINHFAISIHTLDDADKFGYTGASDADSSAGDCLIYRPRYGDPTEATGWNGKYNFYYSYLYDDVKQESPLIEFNDHTTSSPAAYYEFTGTPLYLKFYAQQASSKGWNHATSGNARITGANIYYTEVDDSGNRLIPSKYYLCTVDFEKGTRIDSSYDWEAWAGGAGGSIGEWHAPSTNLIKLDLPPTVHTFSTKAGYDVTERISNLYFKTALVANRMAYIGNIKYDDEDGKTYTKGDAILKSHVNKFDLFTLGRSLEASIRDGDSIVKLEEYADRLLQFKENKMHLINVSQDIEFLEDTFMHKGVNHHAAVCKTDFGVAWVNNLGCYLYDGQKVTNLLEKGGRQIIKESNWSSFITDNSIIGYIPKKRQLIVLKDCTATSVGDIYLYDMVTQSWVEGDSKFTDSQIQTNFITDWNGDLIHAHTSDTGTVEKWDDSGDSSATFSTITKDIDFGQPSQRKKIYKVYVSYKGDGTSVTINYTTNGDNDTYSGQFYRCNADGSTTGSTASNVPLHQASVGTDDWINAELKPTASINNIYSLQLKFDGDTSDPNFEINDISIVYRLKNVK